MKLSTALPQEISLKLADGNLYHFSELHLNAQAAVEEHFNLSLLEADEQGRNGLEKLVQDHLSKEMTAWRFLTYQLLRKRHRDIDEEEVGYLINPMVLPHVMTTCMKQVMNSFPIPDEVKKDLALQLEAAMKPMIGD